MFNSTESRADAEREVFKRSDLEAYRRGLDLVFGIETTELSDEDKKAIIKCAERASIRQLSNWSGEEVILNEKIANHILMRLGEEKTRQYLGIYKGEIEEKLLTESPMVTEEMEKNRSEAREALFTTKNIRRIVFS
ncbi:TPA: hypothetical protein DCP77_01600 [Candidatus Collierbacteria bacterium]|uniref:Uncharacterized protein n=1 Tax=Candidatus Collierbacteria bacterium GW2011_GWA2_42_17 TaxID=1618378 RepID=A0A0G0Z1G5_9BACT|nr:MAG: hypothetical protein UU94_C0018G0007 [Candidatus Collierbacteria bacterium GW2011_GWB2_42_12]KKS42594.1 MAG: hypothetical protein UV06_C0009G0009 [Candidatus Collierbacteria bacterium GW2011_GWA2_42_17]KKS61314.1 MAG: hypothetical protein UV29_C0042G0003 [Candidatus Collierbacteria bacterium GW2011_GWD2_42_50]KKS62093.1 MAG: hypothetical protein UV28_C0018G0006 [Candidatus Collierbacteria bacterium GW2011_GWE2_42_48]KKS64041.1 MAG: hypothetical protein UV32_C0027G0007 [Candidatus Collie